MKKLRASRFQRAAVVTSAVLVLAGVTATTARADYWGFQGWMYPNPTEPYTWGLFTGETYYRFIRLNRSNCAPKMQIHDASSGWYQVYWGCGVTDTNEYPYGWEYGEDAARAINNDSYTGWANVAIGYQ